MISFLFVCKTNFNPHTRILWERIQGVFNRAKFVSIHKSVWHSVYLNNTEAQHSYFDGVLYQYRNVTDLFCNIINLQTNIDSKCCISIGTGRRFVILFNLCDC